MSLLDAIFGKSDSGIPGWYEDQAKNIINFTNMAARVNPPIWGGPVVAEVPGSLRGAWDQTHAWNLAAGLPTGSGGPSGRSVTPSMEFDARMAPYQVPGGYSSMPVFQQGMAATSEAYPGIFDALYQMYPALAPEGYQADGITPWGGSSWLGGANPEQYADIAEFLGYGPGPASDPNQGAGQQDDFDLGLVAAAMNPATAAMAVLGSIAAQGVNPNINITPSLADLAAQVFGGPDTDAPSIGDVSEAPGSPDPYGGAGV